MNSLLSNSDRAVTMAMLYRTENVCDRESVLVPNLDVIF